MSQKIAREAPGVQQFVLNAVLMQYFQKVSFMQLQTNF